MKNMYYILKDGRPEPVTDVLEWAIWFENADRIINQTWVGESRISTVFLGLDYSSGQGRRPILYETMVFGGPLNDETERYATVEEAKSGHDRMVERVRAEKGTS